MGKAPKAAAKSALPPPHPTAPSDRTLSRHASKPNLADRVLPSAATTDAVDPKTKAEIAAETGYLKPATQLKLRESFLPSPSRFILLQSPLANLSALESASRIRSTRNVLGSL